MVIDWNISIRICEFLIDVANTFSRGVVKFEFFIVFDSSIDENISIWSRGGIFQSSIKKMIFFCIDLVIINFPDQIVLLL